MLGVQKQQQKKCKYQYCIQTSVEICTTSKINLVDPNYNNAFLFKLAI